MGLTTTHGLRRLASRLALQDEPPGAQSPASVERLQVPRRVCPRGGLFRQVCLLDWPASALRVVIACHGHGPHWPVAVAVDSAPNVFRVLCVLLPALLVFLCLVVLAGLLLRLLLPRHERHRAMCWARAAGDGTERGAWGGLGSVRKEGGISAFLFFLLLFFFVFFPVFLLRFLLSLPSLLSSLLSLPSSSSSVVA